MNAFWSFVVSQFVLLIGIAGSVWVGRSTQTGPRRKIEDLKLAAEALQVVESPEQRQQIVLFMERETKQLARLSDRRGRLARLGGVILSIAAIGFTVWAVVVSILSNANLLPSSGVSWTRNVEGWISGAVWAIGALVTAVGVALGTYAIYVRTHSKK